MHMLKNGVILKMNNNEKGIMKEIAGDFLYSFLQENDKAILVNADLAREFNLTKLIDDCPEQMVNVGIAEQNMISVSAGLALEGFIPICITFSSFATMRCCEQIRSDACYGDLPLIILATYSGYSGAIMGATHSGLEDCAIVSSFENMIVLEPSDPWSIKNAILAAYKAKKPTYIRMGSAPYPQIYSKDKEFIIGKATLARDGSDGAFIVSGVTTFFALEAAERIYKDLGKHVQVVDMGSIKPIDADAILSATKTGKIICAQDHNKNNGLGSAVAKVLALNGISCQFDILGCEEKYVPLATPEFMYHKNGYDADGLYEHMSKMLSDNSVQ